jgi:hypothetical protein
VSTYGDLSKPQREILRNLLEHSAVSIDTAVSCRARQSRPYARLADLGLIEYQRSFWEWYKPAAWLTPAGLRLAHQVRRNAATPRYSRFRMD